jgi:hypothetical protein
VGTAGRQYKVGQFIPLFPCIPPRLGLDEVMGLCCVNQLCWSWAGAVWAQTEFMHSPSEDHMISGSLITLRCTIVNSSLVFI